MPINHKWLAMPQIKILTVFLVILLTCAAQAEEKDKSGAEKETKPSKWIGAPLITSDPKVSTAVGAMGGYIHTFDEMSPPSIFAVTGTYSTTDSWYAGIFAKTYFAEDRHRLIAGAMTGQIRNDYDDFLGSGLPAQTTDDLSLYILRYMMQVHGHWYAGLQGISTNYAISGDDYLSGEIIQQVGLTGFDSNGIGLYAQYDTRDNQYSPATGQMFEAHNVAYRKGLGGDVSFDTYTVDYRYFLPHDKENVLAMHAKGRWTQDAPPSGYSSVDFRGYTRGQYLAPYMTLAEIEERYSLKGKWGLAVFAGLAVLYGGDAFEGSDQLFPSGGGGVTYEMNEEKMVIRADIAVGKDDNWGFYLQFGQPF